MVGGFYVMEEMIAGLDPDRNFVTAGLDPDRNFVTAGFIPDMNVMDQVKFPAAG